MHGASHSASKPFCTCHLACAGTQIVFLQQRSPAMTGRQEAFAKNLAEFLSKHGVKQVIILSGLDAQLMRDKQIEGPRIR